MKKKIFNTLLYSFIILSIAGCGKSTDDLPREITLHNNSENEMKETLEIENSIGNVPDEISIDPNEEQMEQDLQAINNMIPLMDSIMLCMFENDYEFDTTNSNFVWNIMLYYVGNHLVHLDESIVSDDYSSATIPKEDVFDYMKGYILNTVPDFEQNEETSLITENEDSYSFGLGDRGLSETKMIGFSKNTDNSLDVDLKLVSMDDNSNICTGSFHIEPINDETKYFGMVIVNATIQRPQPKILSGTIVEIQNDESVILKINGEEKKYLLNKNSSSQITTKSVGNSIDVMIDKDILINILN